MSVFFKDNSSGVVEQYGVTFPDSSVQWCNVDGTGGQWFFFGGQKYNLAQSSGVSAFLNAYHSMLALVRATKRPLTREIGPRFMVREVKFVVVEGSLSYLRMDQHGALIHDQTVDPVT